PTPPGQTLRDSLLAFLGPRRLLLVVDNVEQLLPAGPLVEQALARAPGLKGLATSRGPLRIRGEKVVAVSPLALPNTGAPAALDTLAAVRVVAFFVACGHDAQPGFELTEANAAAVAEICRRLDGLPLALQLAASRLAILPPAALLCPHGSRRCARRSAGAMTCCDPPSSACSASLACSSAGSRSRRWRRSSRT